MTATTGRASSVNAERTLVDCAAPDGMSTGALSTRLDRLRQLEDALRAAAFQAFSLGLDATWAAIDAAAANVDAAIADVRRQLRERR